MSPLNAVSVAALALLPLAAAAQDTAMHETSGHGAMMQDAGPDTAMARYGAAMDAMMTEMEQVEPSGDADIDFLRMMIPHHRSAVAMAEALLEEGGDDPETRAMAEAVIASQTPEIAAMRRRLAALEAAAR